MKESERTARQTAEVLPSVLHIRTVERTQIVACYYSLATVVFGFGLHYFKNSLQHNSAHSQRYPSHPYDGGEMFLSVSYWVICSVHF